METPTTKGRFSYSKLNQYITCPFAYYNKYVKGMFYDKPTVATEFGVLVHKIEEMITNTLLRGESVDYDFLKNFFVTADIPKTSPYDRDGGVYGTEVLKKRYSKDWLSFDNKTGKSYAAKASEYLATGIYRQEKFLKAHPELELVGAEIEFKYVYRDYLFYGFIDRLFRYKEDHKHFVVHDIKTKDKPFADKELVTPLQFVVYSEAIKEQYGADVIVECVYDLPIANIQQNGGTKGFVARGIKKINSVIDAIEAEDFTPCPSALCYWCAYSNTNPAQPPEAKNTCPYYSLWNPKSKNYSVKFAWEGMDKHELQMRKLLKIENEENAIKDKPFVDFHF